MLVGGGELLAGLGRVGRRARGRPNAETGVNPGQTLWTRSGSPASCVRRPSAAIGRDTPTRRGGQQLHGVAARDRPGAVPQPGHRRQRDHPDQHRHRVGRRSAGICHVIGDFTWTGWDYLEKPASDAPTTATRRPRSPSRSTASIHGWPPGAATSTSPATPAPVVSTGRSSSVCGRALPGRPAAPAPRQTFTGTPWAWATRCELDLARIGRRAGHGRGVQRRRRGRTPCQRPLGGSPARRGSAPLPVGLRGQRTNRAGWRPSPGATEPKSDARRFAPPKRRWCSTSAPIDRPVIAANPEDLAFVTLSLVDGDGTLHVLHDRRIDVQVEGPGVLQALGSANPATEEGFVGTELHLL